MEKNSKVSKHYNEKIERLSCRNKGLSSRDKGLESCSNRQSSYEEESNKQISDFMDILFNDQNSNNNNKFKNNNNLTNITNVVDGFNTSSSLSNNSSENNAIINHMDDTNNDNNNNMTNSSSFNNDIIKLLDVDADNPLFDYNNSIEIDSNIDEDENFDANPKDQVIADEDSDDDFLIVNKDMCREWNELLRSLDRDDSSGDNDSIDENDHSDRDDENDDAIDNGKYNLNNNPNENIYTSNKTDNRNSIRFHRNYNFDIIPEISNLINNFNYNIDCSNKNDSKPLYHAGINSPSPFTAGTKFYKITFVFLKLF